MCILMSDEMQKSNTSHDPFLHLLTDLQSHHDRITSQISGDVVHGTTKNRYNIEPSEFLEIKMSNTQHPKKMAFVDGGNDTLDQSPSHLIALNRIYYTIFQGTKKLSPAHNTTQRTTFLSCVTPHTPNDNSIDTLTFDTKLYVFGDQNDKDAHDTLPKKDDLLEISSDGNRNTIDGTMPLISLPRRLAEIKLATKVVSDELDAGDMLVMDGSLQTPFGVQGKYADDLYKLAIEKNVIICGLAKTSRLITESGNSLLPRIADISRHVSYERWYVPVAQKIYHESRGFTLCVKLHPNAKFVFRLDILNEQFKGMSDTEKNDVLASLAYNSNDLLILGYPYGAIESDKYAKVRSSEAAMLKRMLYSRRAGNDKWQNIAKNTDSVIFHDLLNKVTG